MLNKLFVVEGPEGSFKSTVVRKVTEKLCERGIGAIASREPGGVGVSEKIRDIVVHDDMCIETEVLLFLASRVEHYNKVIKPNLEDGKIVVLDRFMYSTLSIQGEARGYSIDSIRKLHEIAFGERIQTTTFYIDIDPEVSIKRKEGYEIQKFEKEDLDFHQKAHKYMLDACVNHPNVIRIDGYKTSDEIAEAICTIITLINDGYSVRNTNNDGYAIKFR